MELFKRYHSITNQTVYTLPTGEKVYPAVVDVKKGMQGGGDISYVETDNNVGFIIVSLVEGESKFKIPSTATVTCNIKRPDGHFLEIDCTKMDESTVQIALGSAGTKVEGVHSFDIKIQYSDDIVIGTPIMSYMVQSGLTLDGAIEEDERLPMLTALIEEVKTIHESTTELAEEVSELSENIGAIVEGAGARLDEEIAEFRMQSEELIASANSAVEEVNNSLEQITTSLEEVNQGIDEVNDAISEVNTALEEVNSNMDRIDSVIIEANQAIESMEDTQNTSIELNEQSEMLISEMQGLIADGLDIEELITARDGEESLSARLDRDLQGVYEYVDNKQVDLSPVESKIAENTKKLNTHERLIDNNLNSIGSLNTRITNNTTEISNTKQEITTKVNALKTEIGEDIVSINDDVARIQEELQKSENTKYSTTNGVKEFSCKDGYVDNVVVEGKTLVNLFSFKKTESSNNNSVWVHINTDYISLFKEVEYTLINTSDKSIFIDIYSNDTNSYKRNLLIKANSSIKDTLTSNEHYSKCTGLFSDSWSLSDLSVISSALVILEGDHTDKPISYFEGLKSVGQGDKIEVLTINGSKYDLSGTTYVNGFFNSTGGLTINDKHKVIEQYLEVEEDKIYVLENIAHATCYYDVNKNLVHYNIDALICNSPYPQHIQDVHNVYYAIVKIPKGVKYIRVSTGINSVGKINIYKDGKYDHKQISTTLRSLPNGVKDTIEKRGNKYVKVQRCGEYTLVESDVLSIQNIRENCCAIITNRFPKQRKLKNADLKDTLLCNMFSQKPHIKYDEDIEGIHEQATQNQDMFFDILKSKLPSVDVNGAKTWLASNPVTVVYELEAPIITELPNFNPQTYEGDTTLLLNTGAIQGECSFEVTNSMGSEIEVLKDKVSNNDSSLLLKSDKGHYHSCDENITMLYRGSLTGVSGDIPLTDSVLNYKSLIVSLGNVSGGRNTSFIIYPFNFGYRQVSDGKIRDTEEMYITVFSGATPYKYYFKPSSTSNNLYFEIRDSSNFIVSSNPDAGSFSIRSIVGVK